jgi:ribosome-binding factor A
MFKTVEGVFRNGQIELFEIPKDLQEARVYVTFLPAKNHVDLSERGIDEQQAADLRWR